MTVRRSTIMFCAAGLLLAACTGGDDGGADDAGTEVDRGAVLTELADDVIIPSYEALAVGFDQLGASIQTLCAMPGREALEAAQADWRSVDQAWRRSRAAGIGPAMERRLVSSIGFLARADAIEEILAGNEPLDPAALDQAGVGVKGLSAIETALFAEGSEALSAGGGGGRRCEYAAAATVLAGRSSAAVLDDWTGPLDHRATFVEGMNGDEQSSTDAVVNETIFRVTELDDQGLRSLVEAESPAELTANRADGPAAYRLAELQATLDGVAAALGHEGDIRIVALLRGISTDTANRLQQALADAEAAMDALPDSVTAAFQDRPALEAARKAVAALRVLLSTEVASELGVTIGFSDADGDS